MAFGSTGASPRVIDLKVEKIGDKTHWVPEKITVKPGEKITLNASYNLVGGFDFHGLTIPEFKIDKKVERNKVTTVDLAIPEKGPKEISVNCKFHPAHVGAKMIVEP